MTNAQSIYYFPSFPHFATLPLCTLHITFRRFALEAHTMDTATGFTKEELLNSGEISSKTFDMIRKAARVRGPAHGGLSYVFTLDDVATLVLTAEGGRFTERGAPAAVGWRTLPGVQQYLDNPPSELVTRPRKEPKR